jgi:hypothetical protein
MNKVSINQVGIKRGNKIIPGNELSTVR